VFWNAASSGARCYRGRHRTRTRLLVDARVGGFGDSYVEPDVQAFVFAEYEEKSA
jgi:hypothetical protein